MRTLVLTLVVVALDTGSAAAQPPGDPTCEDPFYPAFTACVQSEVMQPSVTCIAAYNENVYAAKCGARFLPPSPPNCEGPVGDFWYCVELALNAGNTCEIWAQPSGPNVVFKASCVPVEIGGMVAIPLYHPAKAAPRLLRV